MNVNIQCKVTLTHLGAAYLNKVHLNEISEISSIFAKFEATSEINKIFPTNYKEGDVLILPLWELIYKFGEYFKIYTEAAFKNNEIEFLDD